MNMDGKDLPSSDDESDVDFVPKDTDFKSDTGSEESDYKSSYDEDKSDVTHKRKKLSKRFTKKVKNSNNESHHTEEYSETKEGEKIDVDALWEDFKKDVSNKTTKSSNVKSDGDSLVKKDESIQSTAQKDSAPVRSKGIVNFPIRNKSGLSVVLNQIGKKDKMTTLQKSQLDWNNFKKSEGIEEEIKLHNRGKDGYLEKQDFLQRTDVRQFELEKDIRTARRKF